MSIQSRIKENKDRMNNKSRLSSHYSKFPFLQRIGFVKDMKLFHGTVNMEKLQELFPHDRRYDDYYR